MKVIPNKVDLRIAMPKIFDQGMLNSCAANALSSQLCYLHSTNNKFSRLFIYFGSRESRRTINTDSGSLLKDGIDLLSTHGCCLELNWPYDISNFRKRPNKEAYLKATHYKLKSYKQISTFDSMIESLNDSTPFSIGIPRFSQFEKNAMTTRILTLPSDKETFIGNHAMVIVGYDLTTQHFIARNSRGVSWGDKGHLYIDFDYMIKYGMVDDAWALIS